MRLKIIIVDDNPAVLRHLVSLLETEFEVVATADNGLSGLECIRRHMPDLVVIDLAMPILNGIELINELKNIRPSHTKRWDNKVDSWTKLSYLKTSGAGVG